MLLAPILPERSLGMLYAPRGIGKSWLSLSIGLAVASGQSLLRWSAPRPRTVLYVDGEIPLVSLQERLKLICTALDCTIPNNQFRVLASDHVPFGTLNLSTDEGQRSLEPLLSDIDLLILDNLSTLCTTGSESASDAWVPMQNWLLKLRRRGISVLLIHHAGVNGRQRGTSRREDALDTVIAYADRRITRRRKVRGLRCTLRSYEIEQVVLGHCHSRQAFNQSQMRGSRQSDGHTRTLNHDC
jgi:putative DNA primase/helicase